MIAIADADETGEIDFERFCYVVLGVTKSEFRKWIEAHIQKPVEVLSARTCISRLLEGVALGKIYTEPVLKCVFRT